MTIDENPFRATTKLGYLADHNVEGEWDLRDKLIQRRVDLGLSQADLAERLSWSLTGVQEFETYYFNPKLNSFTAYALAVHMKISYLTEAVEI